MVMQMLRKLLAWLARRKGAVEAVDHICRVNGLPEYSMLRRYAPVQYLYTLKDEPGIVYVWKLAPRVDEEKFTKRMVEIVAKEGRETRALHVYTTDVEGITRLDADEVRALIEHYYSDDATKGGR